MSERSLRVLIVDDHPLTSGGVRDLLVGAGQSIVTEAATGQEALAAAATYHPDLAIVDLSLPDMSGFEVISILSETYDDIRCVVYSMHEEDEYVVRAVQAGAYGYVFKTADPGQLIAAVRAIGRGQRYLPPEVSGAVIDNYVSDGPAPPKLTMRERQVLRFVAQGWSNRRIGEDLNISVRTVETYRARLIRKLDLHTVAELTRYAIEQGILPG